MIRYTKFKFDESSSLFSGFSIFFTDQQYSAEHSLGNADEDYRVNKHLFKEWIFAFVATVAKMYRLMAEKLCM